MIENILQRNPIIAYEPRFDREAYASANTKDKERLNSYTKRQLETHLGERFNVVLSTTRYEIRGGQIFGENTNEPFMQMLQRGVDYRRMHGNPIDFEREQAELVGFGKTQQDLADDKAPIGKMRLSISPPSGSYKHSFYDIFTLKEDGNGRFIEAKRYSSALSADQTVQMLLQKGLVDQDYSKIPQYLLSHPIELEPGSDTFKTADDIHKYLHKNHDYITEEVFNEVRRMTAFFAISYINSLLEIPIEERDQLLYFNAYLNAGDIALEIVRNKAKFTKNFIFEPIFQTKAEIYTLGMQPVRIVATGCGASGGFSVGGINQAMSSPFSVSEFSQKASQKEWFNCPKCGYEASGPIGDICPGCKLTKEKYVEEGGSTCE